MSIQAVAWVLDHSEAQGSDRLVMICLANRADEDGVCWPSVGKMAHESRMSPRSVQRALQNLCDAQEIRRLASEQLSQAARVRYESLRPDRRPCVYSLCGVSNCHPAIGDGVTDRLPRGDNNAAYGVTPVSPEPSIEPLVKNREISSLSWAAEQTTGWTPANPQCENSECVNGWVDTDRGLVRCEVCNVAEAS